MTETYLTKQTKNIEEIFLKNFRFEHEIKIGDY